MSRKVEKHIQKAQERHKGLELVHGKLSALAETKKSNGRVKRKERKFVKKLKKLRKEANGFLPATVQYGDCTLSDNTVEPNLTETSCHSFSNWKHWTPY